MRHIFICETKEPFVKKSYVPLLAALVTLSPLNGMEKEQKESKKYTDGGPMNAEWFYDENSKSAHANNSLNNRNWSRANEQYGLLLRLNTNTTQYERDLMRINKASAQFARGEQSVLWKNFDRLIEEKENRVGQNFDIKSVKEEDTVHIDTSQIGIGDMAHFHRVLEGVPGKKTIAIKGFLHETFKGIMDHYKTKMVKPGEVKPEDCTYSTHLISLIGHTKKSPSDLAPSQVLLTVPEKTAQTIRKILAQYADRKKAVVFCGENREAIVMGGRKLKRRHLDASSFEALLRKYPQLMLISGNPGNKINFNSENQTNVTMDAEFKDRVIQLPDEGFAFDQSIGLALIINEMEGSVAGFLADNGPSNVYATALTQQSKDHTAYILPDIAESDMRMAGNGVSYKQPLTGCWVYPCTNPDQQGEVIMGAYKDLA